MGASRQRYCLRVCPILGSSEAFVRQEHECTYAAPDGVEDRVVDLGWVVSLSSLPRFALRRARGPPWLGRGRDGRGRGDEGVHSKWLGGEGQRTRRR